MRIEHSDRKRSFLPFRYAQAVQEKNGGYSAHDHSHRPAQSSA